MDSQISDTNSGSVSMIHGVEHGPFLPSGSTLNNIFNDTCDIQDDTVIEVSTPAGVCGLRNLGNTCFMAAGLQCLTASPTVLGHFLDLEDKNNDDDKLLTPSGTLMSHFSKLLTKMWSGKYSVVRPIEFKQTLGAYHSQFKDYRQHDCQEFLALLLDTLHEQMNAAKTLNLNHLSVISTTAITATTTTTTTTTANSTNNLDNNSTKIVDNDLLTATINDDDNLFNNSPLSDCPNSPNVTMAGSPRGLDSSIDDLDSVANSLSGSPINDDDLIDNKTDFIYNNKIENNNTNQLNGTNEKNNCNDLNDIIKNAKTSNTNLLGKNKNFNDTPTIKSEKYTNKKINNTTNLIENHDFNSKLLITKRINDVVNNDKTDCLTNDECFVKRMKYDDNDNNSLNTILNYNNNGAVATDDEVDADKFWIKHLKSNQSIIVDTFQGQFKSTVVCAECKHVSVTYEPFMYLSVPLPHAMERQLTVTYVPASNEPATRCVLSLNKQSRVVKMKEELIKLLGIEDLSTNNIAFAEVLEDHIARILDDNMLLRHVDDTNRTIYAFELTEPPAESTTTTPDATSNDRLTDTDLTQNNTNDYVEIGPCIICLEELDGDLSRHDENNCKFVVCDNCVEGYFTVPRDCPCCPRKVDSTSFTKIDQTGRPRPAIRILNVPLVLRHDTTDEAPNNCKGTKLFGNPHLVKLPSRIDAKDLHDVIKKIVPQDNEYTIHFVDGQGHHCSRCMWNSRCTGCKVPDTGLINISSNDTLAVRYTDNVPKQIPPIDHISIKKQRPPHPLSLYDCLQAFSQSETLDEHNPWYCPKCEKNQCATKTLTVHRYPQYLIVYLKRFVFHECVSMKLDNKVTFPLAGLNVGRHLYDLYACVCHFGGVAAGHYTAYAKNPRTDIWHYYNDEITSRQKPQDEDFSNAYILFYSRQGTNNSKPNNI
ncbi:hypothetical protein HCN44_000793 [Aphidius gifuensis]|uniref:ubiquitinyl hydrolase 1 n=1 Tax=Aphidius gifuensis TaxID=684658 RepID=A0A834XPD6_APHGI|nr:ubiquitin carboxyl-terminal hydrolase 32-like [Aphidius gifuensis]KAF7990988.1 hypothetical protein HCN44_000793 [Aphidius gifuensis]